MPRIEKVMTLMPHTIGKKILLEEAISMMKKYQIRHLPVLEAGDLVGVVTDRDVKLASSFQGASRLTVEDIMTPNPYCIDPKTPVDHVTDAMAEHRYGCAVIRQENGKVVGIFTAVDALRVLSETLQTHYKNINS